MPFRGSARSFLAFAFLTAGVVACGGGSAGVVIPTATPSVAPTSQAATPTPVPAPNSTPFVQSAQTPLPAVTAPPVGHTPAPVPIALPTAGGFSGALSLPISGAAAGTQAQASLTNQAPSGIVAFSLRHSMYAHAPQTAQSEITPLLYIGLLFSANVSVANQPTLSLTMPASYVIPGTSYYLAIYDPTNPQLGWQQGFEGPGTLSGSQVTFTGSASSGAFTYVAWNLYWLALYVQPQNAATPTPAPTATPTPVPPAPTPTPTPVVLSGIALNAIGATQTITPNGSGPYIASSSNTAVATVSVSGSTVTVTAVAVGTATITVNGSGGSTSVPVTVTTTTIPVQ